MLRFVPNPWGTSRFDYVKAVVIALILVLGLAVAIGRSAWIVAAVWGVLLVIALVTWARDLVKAVRQRSGGTGRS